MEGHVDVGSGVRADGQPQFVDPVPFVIEELLRGVLRIVRKDRRALIEGYGQGCVYYAEGTV